jgi:hypothetical protein
MPLIVGPSLGPFSIEFGRLRHVRCILDRDRAADIPLARIAT